MPTEEYPRHLITCTLTESRVIQNFLFNHWSELRTGNLPNGTLVWRPVPHQGDAELVQLVLLQPLPLGPDHAILEGYCMGVYDSIHHLKLLSGSKSRVPR